LPLKKNLVEKDIQLMQVHEYLEKVLRNRGFAGVKLQKTALGLRITIKTAYPGSVIGARGVRIRKLSEDLEKKFGFQNPQIEVDPIRKPELNAQIMAEAIVYGIKKGQNFRRTAYSVMRRIMKAGARGVEVRISGKSTSQRARTLIFRSGVISKCGTPAIEGVNKGFAEAIMKLGLIGVQVKIMSLDYNLPDEIIMKDPNIPDIKKIREEEIIDEDYIIEKGTSEIIEEKGLEESIFDMVEENDIEEIQIEDEKSEVESIEEAKEGDKIIEEADMTINDLLGDEIEEQEKDILKDIDAKGKKQEEYKEKTKEVAKTEDKKTSEEVPKKKSRRGRKKKSKS